MPLPAYIFIAVLAVRLLVLARLAESPFFLPSQGDMHFYNEWAQRIVRGEWTDYRAFYGLPLYAYLVAALYKLFGFSPFIPGFTQACLDAGTAAILFALARTAFGRQQSPETPGTQRSSRWAVTAIGLLAAGGWAFFLPAQSYSVILMPTAWLVFIFWAIVWNVLRRNSAAGATWFFLHGLLIGFAAMGIATILFLIPFVLVVGLANSAFRRSAKSKWLRAAAATAMLTVGVGVGTSPAWIHNCFIARDPVFLSAHSGVNLWIGNNPEASGYPRFPLGLRAGQQAMLQDSITGAEAAVGRPLKRSEVSRYWSEKAKAYISANPAEGAALLGRKIANFWNAFQYDDLSIITSLREQGITLPGLRFGIIAALGLAGAILAWRDFPASRWILAAVLLHMAALLSVFVTERYRLAAVPGLLLFAGFALWRLWETIAVAEYRRAAICVVLVLVSATVVSARRGDAELWAVEPYNSGLQALEAGRLDSAERKLRVASAYVPDNAELNFALGNLYLARGNRREAISQYERTLALDARHKGSFNNLGVLALEGGHPNAAMRFLEKASELAPGDGKTRYLLAQAALASGNIDRALAEIEVAISLDQDRPEFAQLRESILARRLEAQSPPNRP